MKHYINGIRAFKAKFSDYMEEVTSGFSMPEKKFCFDMVWGILKGGDVLVSDVARAIDERILDSTEKRLTRQLKRFCYSALDDAVMKRAFSVFGQPYLTAIDESDIGKESSFAMEDLDSVRDGSKQGYVFHKGYHMTGIAAIGGSRRHVMGLMMNIYSTKSHGFLSVNEETQNALKRVFYVIGGRSATVTADRGYDDEKFMNFVDSYQKHYVVRAKSNRKYTIGGERLPIGEIRFKGKYKQEFLSADGRHMVLFSTGFIAGHPDIGHPIMLACEKAGEEHDARVYITNRTDTSKSGVESATKDYRRRWPVEEMFRFMKQEFRLEKYLVRNLNGMNCLSRFVTMATNLITEIAMEDGSALKRAISDSYRRFRSQEKKEELLARFGKYGLELYRMKRGVQALLAHARSRPRPLQKVRRKVPRQMTLEECIGENQV